MTSNKNVSISPLPTCGYMIRICQNNLPNNALQQITIRNRNWNKGDAIKWLDNYRSLDHAINWLKV